MAMAHLLIIDDEESICWGFARLAGEMGHQAATAASAEEGLRLAAEQKPDVIVLDVRLPGMDGLTAMRHFHDALGRVPILIITAHGDLATAVEAVRGGAFDYLTKPFDLAVAQRALERALVAPTAPSRTAQEDFPEGELRIVGKSSAMQQVFKRIALVAASDACAHVHGESGTGKELVARAIHEHGLRAGGPFVPVNIASLSPTLAESELFGHVRGAFTGADQPRQGLLEQANGGTIFLDEVADIPMPIQVKLLRALECGEILPVGTNRPVRSDFRIISATHRNLSRRVSEGTFRHDLYFRLITFEIELPPLRQRREDIRLLADHFLAILGARGGTPAASISEETLRELERRPWHGNVRELGNALEHATVLARTGPILPDHLPPPMPATVLAEGASGSTLAEEIRRWTESRLAEAETSGDLYDRLMQLVEAPFFEALMRHFQGQCAPASRSVGLHRTTLRKKLDQYGIDEG